MSNGPVFILGAHKSGTSLLRNLLDGHPQVFALPFESHFFQYYGYWISNNYRRSRPKSYSATELIDVFTDFIRANNDADDRFGDAFVHGWLDAERFKERFSRIRDNAPIAEVFSLFMESAYYSLYGRELDDQIVRVEKSVEHAELAIDIRKTYPDCKFIHIVRNPYANLVSLRRYKSIGHGFPLMHRALQTLENSFYHLEQNQRVLDNYLVIKYEGLVSSPERFMRIIADHIGIDYDETLLRPTLMGEPWGGNSTADTVFKGVSSQNLQKWKQEISSMETYYVNRLFPFMAEKYGYGKMPFKGGFWKPVKGENWPRYLANRVYKYYLT